MPTPAPSRFQSWEFTEQENRSASTLNDFQKKKIQTLQCGIAEQLLNVEAATPGDIQEAEIQRAFLKGQLQILSFLLEMSASMELQINTDEYERHQTAVAVQQPEGPNLFQEFRKSESSSKSQE